MAFTAAVMNPPDFYAVLVALDSQPALLPQPSRYPLELTARKALIFLGKGGSWMTWKMFAAALAVVAAAQPAPAAKAVHIGDMAPNFELRLIDGSSVSLSQLRGQVVVLNFWATWCVPCRQELPLLDSYYRGQQVHGLRVFAVTTEDSLPAYRLKPLFKAMKIESARGIKGPYGPLGGVPTNFVIDRSGRVRYAKAGAFDLDALNDVLVPLLREAE
jgi:cytochrome c biogenesis protein CcmG/thiol:disulfide interchange protein DsbE